MLHFPGCAADSGPGLDLCTLWHVAASWRNLARSEGGHGRGCLPGGMEPCLGRDQDQALGWYWRCGCDSRGLRCECPVGSLWSGCVGYCGQAACVKLQLLGIPDLCIHVPENRAALLDRSLKDICSNWSFPIICLFLES